jgi:hypothetical protein
MNRVLYADVEYFSAVYADAELVEGKWLFEDANGGVQAFFAQHLVHPLTEPSAGRRHPPAMSGRILSYVRQTSPD